MKTAKELSIAIEENKEKAKKRYIQDETFSRDQVAHAIQQFLDWGEKEYGKAQGGYFSGHGWAARCLRYHLEQLVNEND